MTVRLLSVIVFDVRRTHTIHVAFKSFLMLCDLGSVAIFDWLTTCLEISTIKNYNFTGDQTHFTKL